MLSSNIILEDHYLKKKLVFTTFLEGRKNRQRNPREVACLNNHLACFHKKKNLKALNSTLPTIHTCIQDKWDRGYIEDSSVLQWGRAPTVLYYE